MVSKNVIGFTSLDFITVSKTLLYGIPGLFQESTMPS